MPRGGPTAGEGPPGMRTTGPGAVFAFNPVYAVELEPEGQRWSPAEAARFLAATAADPLGLMFRLVVLRGFRRGEAAGQRWAGAHLDDGYLTVDRTILQIGGMVAGGNPKSKAGERRIWLGSGTVALLEAHRRALLADQLRASSAWADNDLIFCARGRIAMAARSGLPPAQRALLRRSPATPALTRRSGASSPATPPGR